MSVLEDLNYTRIWFMGMKSLMPCLGMSKKSYCQGALSSQPFQGDGQFFEMPVVWCKTNVYECLLFHNIYSAEHDAFYKAVHCEVLYGSAIEELMFHRVGDDKSRGIEEEAEHHHNNVVTDYN